MTNLIKLLSANNDTVRWRNHVEDITDEIPKKIESLLTASPRSPIAATPSPRINMFLLFRSLSVIISVISLSGIAIWKSEKIIPMRYRRLSLSAKYFKMEVCQA